jgi:hypothetical protein
MKKYLLGMFLLTASMLGMISCQKMSRPALGNFPQDHETVPSTPLRFFANFDSTSEASKQINIRFGDSISGYPCFFPNSAIKVQQGIHGTAYAGASGVALQYLNANDFSSSSSFTVAFWAKNSVPTGGKAQFAFTLPDKDYWSTTAMFILFDHTGSGATADSAVVKFYVNDNNGDHWFELVGNNRIPQIYDGNWHHLAFAYSETTSNMKVYKDGALINTLSWGGHGPLRLTPSSVFNLVVGGMNKHVNLPGPRDDWMESWHGGIDQFRLYNKALSDAEVAALFNNKQ